MSDNPRKPRLIPVLDVMGGQVVRGVGGRRCSEYRPIESRLTTTSDPRSVMNALLEVTGAHELYIADLDAITVAGFVSQAVSDLVTTSGRTCWVDAGIRSPEALLALPLVDGIRPVFASETCPGLAAFEEMQRTRVDRAEAMSIDLRDGELLGDWRAWGLKDARDVLGLARTMEARGVDSLIVLDLARVGTGAGCGTEDLLRAIRGEFPRIGLIAGGGVKTWADVDRLGEAGADAVLVASGLHDKTITFPRPS